MGAVFAKFDRIPGDVSHHGSSGWVRLLSFQWGDRPGQSRSGDAGRTPGATTATLVKNMDRLSAQLLRAAAAGDRLASVVVHIEANRECQACSFQDVSIARVDYDSSADESETKSEAVTLAFARAQLSRER